MNGDSGGGWVIGLVLAVAGFFLGRNLGSSATEEKLWRYATQRSKAVYVTGVCHGALFEPSLAPLPSQDEFFGDGFHRTVHEDHVTETLEVFEMKAFAHVTEGLEDEFSPADFACGARFLPENLMVDLETLDKWVEEDYPGGVLWDHEHGLTQPSSPRFGR